MPQDNPIQEATFTGTVRRIVFFKGSRFKRRPHELIVEMYREHPIMPIVKTFIAYGHIAATLSGFLMENKTYTVDYEPWIDDESDGELFSARDRNA